MKPNHSPRGRKTVSRWLVSLVIIGTVVSAKPLIPTSLGRSDSKLGTIVNDSLFVGSQFAKGVSRLYLDLISGGFHPPHGMIREIQPTERSNDLPKGLRKVGIAP